MARYTGPQCKIFRRERLNVFDPKTSKHKSLTKKNYPPGQHGSSGFSKQSEYAKQLREKQKAKKIFGILERQFEKYYKMAKKTKDITGDALLKICERRLDNVIYRAGFAKTRPQARQMANHGLFKINNKRVNIPSMLVNTGDIIVLTEKAKKSKLFGENNKKSDTSPKWIKSDLKVYQAEIINLPDKDDLENIINSQLIVEYYSK